MTKFTSHLASPFASNFRTADKTTVTAVSDTQLLVKLPVKGIAATNQASVAAIDQAYRENFMTSEQRTRVRLACVSSMIVKTFKLYQIWN